MPAVAVAAAAATATRARFFFLTAEDGFHVALSVKTLTVPEMFCFVAARSASAKPRPYDVACVLFWGERRSKGSEQPACNL